MKKIVFIPFFLVSFLWSLQAQKERQKICKDARKLALQIKKAKKQYSSICAFAKKIQSSEIYYDETGTPQKAITGNNMSIFGVFMKKRIDLKLFFNQFEYALQKHQYEVINDTNYTDLTDTLKKTESFFEACKTFDKEIKQYLKEEEEDHQKI